MNNRQIDKKENEIMLMLQKDIPITKRPFKHAADRMGISEEKLIFRLKRLKERGLIKRIDFRLDLKKLGFASTLVACKIPEQEISKASDIISNCKNVTHSYLRRSRLNIWFTLSAASTGALRSLLSMLKEKLKTGQLLSFQTKKIFKLGFRLDVK